MKAADDVRELTGGFMPRVGLVFVADISDRLARALPGVTFAFVNEYFATISTATPAELVIYGHAFKPWLQNLAGCLVCPRHEYETARSHVKSILRRLIELTIGQVEVSGHEAGFSSLAAAR